MVFGNKAWTAKVASRFAGVGALKDYVNGDQRCSTAVEEAGYAGTGSLCSCSIDGISWLTRSNLSVESRHPMKYSSDNLDFTHYVATGSCSF